MRKARNYLTTSLYYATCKINSSRNSNNSVSMYKFSQLGFHDYTTYCKSPYFQRCRDLVEGKLCFICETPYTIIPHHADYDHLGQERLYRDLYPLCYNDHTQVHFIAISLFTVTFFTIKVPLTKWFLKQRMLYLRFKYCVQTGKYWLSLWYLTRCLFPVL